MTTLRRSFRRWWQPPRKLSEREEERSVTFLELFYDLVYVVLISQLAHALSTHADLEGVAGFAFLFGLVWLAWLNGTMYHDLHGNNDIRTRVFTFLQMFTVAAMAVFAHNALGEGSAGFALSFAAYQLILTYLWWRTGVHDPDHRPLSQPYALAFLFSTLLFVLSVFLPAPWRFGLWGLGLLISLALPLVTFSLGRNNPQVQAQIDLSLSVSPSAVERFGLFTIIVLGEVIVGVVSGVAGQHHLDWLVGITAALGMAIAIGLWWVYFDYISQHFPISKRSKVASWLYLHLPMTAGIAATGAAILYVVDHAGEPLTAEGRWLLVGAVALALICIALLMRSIQIPDEHQPIYRAGGIVTFVSGLIILLLGLTSIPAIPLLVVLILLLLAPVLYGLKVWIQMLGAEEIPIT
jgi:low temperature requirement protein LtrA